MIRKGAKGLLLEDFRRPSPRIWGAARNFVQPMGRSSNLTRDVHPFIPKRFDPSAIHRKSHKELLQAMAVVRMFLQFFEGQNGLGLKHSVPKTSVKNIAKIAKNHGEASVKTFKSAMNLSLRHIKPPIKATH